MGLHVYENLAQIIVSCKIQWNPNFTNPQGKRKLVRKIGVRGIGGIITVSTEGKRLLVQVIGRFDSTVSKPLQGLSDVS